MSEKQRIVVVGGGTAGLTVSAQLLKQRPHDVDVTIVEPSEKHYYQPLWTLVGAGVFPREESERQEADFMPAGITG